MTRNDFLQLLALDAKQVDQNLEFEEIPSKSPTRILKTVEVFNTGGRKVRLEGHYNPIYDSVTFNFVCPEAGGAICRVDVRGTKHGDAGRTHKHNFRSESDPRAQLPHAVARPDLENASPEIVWIDLCERANIHFTGLFIDPRVPTLPMD